MDTDDKHNDDKHNDCPDAASSPVPVASGRRIMRPHPGPQTQFCASTATIAILAGGCGGGRTAALILDWMRHINSPDARGLLYSEDWPLATGGLWDAATKMLADTGATFRSGRQDVRWPSGATLEVRHHGNLQLGGRWSWIGIDEVQECSMSTVKRLIGCLRGAHDRPPSMRMTVLPAPDHPISEWVSPFLTVDGLVSSSLAGRVSQVPGMPGLTYTVIGCTVEDNPSLASDPGYTQRLSGLSYGMARAVTGSWAPAPPCEMEPRLPREFVVWSPSDDGEPVRLTANSAKEAAKLAVLRDQAEGYHHDNDWSPQQMIVVGYDDGDVTWVTVKVTVEATL